MKVCYLVLAHTCPGALSELIVSLEHPDSTTVVHVDARSDLADFQRAAPDSNVLWVDDRVRCFHSGWSLVDATLRLLRRAPVADYYVLLSGDSYPLRTQDRIHEFLASRNAEWMNLLPLPSPQVNKGLDRLDRYHPIYDPRGPRWGRAVAKIERLLHHRQRDYQAALRDLELWCGSQWWALSRASIEHVLHEVERRPEFVRFCAHTHIPDEHFFHILLGSHPGFRENVRPGVMFTDFSVMPGPAVISTAHVSEWVANGLYRSGEYGEHEELLFARKVFDPAVAALIRERVWSL